MLEQPFFSVVIPLFNKEKFIKATLQSVINQSYKNFEILIINDGSTDKSLNLTNEFDDKRVKIINQKNRGLSASRNKGVELAKAKYIAFLDADDLWNKDYLSIKYQLINKNSEYAFFGSPSKPFFNKNSPQLKSNSFNLEKAKVISNYFKYRTNLFGYSSIVIKKSIFKEIGGFDTSYNYGEEEDFNIRCFRKYDLVYYDEFQSHYRKGIRNQLTNPNKNFNRIIPDYDIYLANNKNEDLKKYIEFIYFKLLVLYKMELNYEKVDYYKKKINPNHLSVIQKIKFHLPSKMFYYLKSIYILFLKSASHF